MNEEGIQTLAEMTDNLISKHASTKAENVILKMRVKVLEKMLIDSRSEFPAHNGKE